MFTKILLTVAVVAIIWFGFKYLQRAAELREKRERAQTRPIAKGATFRDEMKAAEAVKDLVKCRVCNTFRAADLGSCGRGDCPY